MPLPLTPRNPSRVTGLGLGISLGLLLLALSYVRTYGDAQSALIRTNVLDAIFDTPWWGTTLARNLAVFVAGLVVLHVAYGVLCWLLARVSFWLWPSTTTRIGHHVLLWFLSTTLALLASNAAHATHSSLGGPYTELARTEILGIPLWSYLAFAVGSAAAITLLSGAARWLKTSRGARLPAVSALLAVATVGGATAIPGRPSVQPPSERPNVILIGLDSLRRDIVVSEKLPEVAPHLHGFLTRAVSFSNAITPLARTFPSMTSILTGRHPHTTGAVINLLPRDFVKEGDTLPTALRRAGYMTAYATDEVRFSNIDATYGFDITVTPPIGASEFLISFFGDTPLSNHVVNTPLGAVLFPHLHANRGAAVTYDPDEFIERMAEELEVRQPLFLATHLTLAHWPYTWIDAPQREPTKKDEPRPTWPSYYLDAVRRVDQQFGSLMALLEERGLLQNAVVVVYSDHGESFGNETELLVPKDASSLQGLAAAKGSWGHGTSVLIPNQYEIVLAMRAYGSAKFEAAGRQIDAPVATYDIAPTIMELVGSQQLDPPDGRSLVPLLNGAPEAAASFAGRVRFTETEFTPSNLISASGIVSASTAVSTLYSFYDIHPVTDRVQIKRERLKTLLQSRQYAAIGQNLLLAALPNSSSPGFSFVTVDLDSGVPVRLTEPPRPEAPTEMHTLWQALHMRFGDVLGADVVTAGESK